MCRTRGQIEMSDSANALLMDSPLCDRFELAELRNNLTRRAYVFLRNSKRIHEELSIADAELSRDVHACARVILTGTSFFYQLSPCGIKSLHF